MQVFEEYLNVMIGFPFLFIGTVLYGYVKDKDAITMKFVRGALLLTIVMVAANIILFILIGDYRSVIGYIVMMSLAMIYSNIFVPILLGNEYKALYYNDNDKPKWDYMVVVWVLFSVLFLLIVFLPI